MKPKVRNRELIMEAVNALEFDLLRVASTPILKKNIKVQAQIWLYDDDGKTLGCTLIRTDDFKRRIQYVMG